MVHMELSSELLLRIYLKARQPKQPKPMRTHYNANSFG